MYESIKILELMTSVLFNLVFTNTTILPCFFFIFLIIVLCFLIPGVIAKVVNLTVELEIPIGILPSGTSYS